MKCDICLFAVVTIEFLLGFIIGRRILTNFVEIILYFNIFLSFQVRFPNMLGAHIRSIVSLTKHDIFGSKRKQNSSTFFLYQFIKHIMYIVF